MSCPATGPCRPGRGQQSATAGMRRRSHECCRQNRSSLGFRGAPSPQRSWPVSLGLSTAQDRQCRDGKGPAQDEGSLQTRNQHGVSQHTATATGPRCLHPASASLTGHGKSGDAQPLRRQRWQDEPLRGDSSTSLESPLNHTPSLLRNLLISFIFWKMPSRLLRGF